jgi:hypothetical protein
MPAASIGGVAVGGSWGRGRLGGGARWAGRRSAASPTERGARAAASRHPRRAPRGGFWQLSQA